ncbi:MAG: U32 family peptidase [bacterium]|nr:U32 family peptidase [bacterium]
MELLAPAGNLDKLKWAAIYGADAVYFGAEFGSLRNFAGNFSLDDIEAGLKFLHDRGKKGYVTLNIYPFTDEFPKLLELVRQLDDLGADAFIAADLGVIAALNRMKLNASIHISTQASTTNAPAVLAYGDLGASRVNLARELSYEQIQEIQKDVGEKVETEVFVHGAVCFSYSGRCAISDYLTGHQANRGECKQPCRWNFALVEEKRPGEAMPYFEDERGSYFFNSRELALFDYVPRLQEAGVSSIKIEGRMKSIHYIASTVSFYRRIIDGWQVESKEAMELLAKVPNRGYSQGFMKGGIDQDDYQHDESRSHAEAVFVGNVLDVQQDGRAVLEVRNKIHAGEMLEVLRPDGSLAAYTMPEILTSSKGQVLEFANNSQFLVLEDELPPYALLRRVKS